VEHRASLDAVVKRQVCQPLPGFENLIIRPVMQRYTAEIYAIRNLVLFITFSSRSKQHLTDALDSSRGEFLHMLNRYFRISFQK
jgi:hypothetical protein